SDYGATVNWGDGSPPDSNVVIAFSGGVFTVQGRHRYGEESSNDHPGTNPYPITVTVHHEGSTEAAPVGSTALVTDASVVGKGGFAVKATEGLDSGLVTVATFTDPGGSEAVEDYSATVVWGDGTVADPTATVTFANGTFTVRGHHKFIEET